MHEEILIGVTAVIALGILAQWMAWRFRMPAILLLLLAGFVAGPLSGLVRQDGKWLAPDNLFGDILFPIVSLSVAIILFEGGLTLKLGEFKIVGRVVRNLVTIGVLVTWLVCGTAAHYVLGFDWPMSLLLGAMLTVTGPTVIGPLLRQVRPAGTTGTVLKWEGILIDPVGAVLAVLVFEAIVAQISMHGIDEHGTSHLLMEIANAIGFTLFDGLLIGGTAAALLIVLMKRYWVPDYLQSPVTLVLVVLAFTTSNHFREESGLLAVTVMGIILANQKFAPIRHIIEFKENLRVLLISGLFILLSARLPLETVQDVGWAHLWFLLVVIFVARPLAVWLSTIHCGLDWRQRLFIGMVAPRGIVAAAIASIFAIKLGEIGEGYEEARQLVPAMFLVIVGTITFCGLTAAPLARWLKLSVDNPQGVLLIGAQAWAREIAEVLKHEGFETLLIDTNRANTRAARMAGFQTVTGSVLSEHIEETLDLARFSKLIALTGNDEANALAAVQMTETFGRKEIYQLPPYAADHRAERDSVQEPGHYLTGRFLVGKDFHYRHIQQRIDRGAEVRATPLTQTFGWEQYQQQYGERATPLFLITESVKLRVFTAVDPPRPSADETVIALVDPEPDKVVAGPAADPRRDRATPSPAAPDAAAGSSAGSGVRPALPG